MNGVVTGYISQEKGDFHLALPLDGVVKYFGRFDSLSDCLDKIDEVTNGYPVQLVQPSTMPLVGINFGSAYDCVKVKEMLNPSLIPSKGRSRKPIYRRVEDVSEVLNRGLEEKIIFL
tara:strand:- start:355 stop:705 length:351 start_codon:yes stop_codon:yes gene_type:complete